MRRYRVVAVLDQHTPSVCASSDGLLATSVLVNGLWNTDVCLPHDTGDIDRPCRCTLEPMPDIVDS